MTIDKIAVFPKYRRPNRDYPRFHGVNSSRTTTYCGHCTKAATPLVQNPDITDIETLTVSSPLFTFPNLVAFVGLVSAIVGLLRSAKTGSTEKQPAIDSKAKE